MNQAEKYANLYCLKGSEALLKHCQSPAAGDTEQIVLKDSFPLPEGDIVMDEHDRLWRVACFVGPDDKKISRPDRGTRLYLLVHRDLSTVAKSLDPPRSGQYPTGWPDLGNCSAL